MSLHALVGGAIVAGTTSDATVDCRTFIGQDVLIFCATQDVLFSASSASSGNVLITTATAPSATALIADRAPAGFGKVRRIMQDQPYLAVKLAAGSDTIVIKPVAKKASESR